MQRAMRVARKPEDLVLSDPVGHKDTKRRTSLPSFSAISTVSSSSTASSNADTLGIHVFNCTCAPRASRKKCRERARIAVEVAFSASSAPFAACIASVRSTIPRRRDRTARSSSVVRGAGLKAVSTGVVVPEVPVSARSIPRSTLGSRAAHMRRWVRATEAGMRWWVFQTARGRQSLFDK